MNSNSNTPVGNVQRRLNKGCITVLQAATTTSSSTGSTSSSSTGSTTSTSGPSIGTTGTSATGDVSPTSMALMPSYQYNQHQHYPYQFNSNNSNNTHHHDGNKERIQENNPLRTDPVLKELLNELDSNSINTVSKFRYWKHSFLRRYDIFLEQSGIIPAQKEYNEFCIDLIGFYTKCCLLDQAVVSGALTTTSSSVKGRNALNECHQTCVDVTERLVSLLPSTGTEEKKCGYNKFQLGAILIRDNFMAYDTMISTQSILLKLRDDNNDNDSSDNSHDDPSTTISTTSSKLTTPTKSTTTTTTTTTKLSTLSQIADRQIIDQIDNYVKKIQNFCDIMASLALFDVMTKCIKFGRGDGLHDLIIFVDAQTGTIGELSKQSLINAGLLTLSTTSTTTTPNHQSESTTSTGTTTTTIINEAAIDTDKQILIDILREKLQL